MRRKILAVMSLILMLLMGNYACLAEEQQPILFRGIPYASSASEVLSELADFRFSKFSIDYGCDVPYYIYEDGDIKYTDYVCAKTTSSNPNQIKVAGYEVDAIRLLFAFTPDSTGILPKDNDHAAFMLGEYTLDVKDIGFAMSDLTAKLTSLYGEPAEHRTHGRSISYEYYVWRGAEGTIVSLISKQYSSGSNSLYIRYTFDGADTYYQAAMDALAYEEFLNIDRNDTTGL